MRDAHVQQEILRYVEQLGPESQQRVLEFAKALKSIPKGVPGRDLLRFAGTLSLEDAAEIEQAIEEGCERVEPDAW